MVYKHGKHEIEIFDSIHNLPILRFQRFNKYQMMSLEVGNTFLDFDQRNGKIIQFLKKGMNEEALKELENRRLTAFNAYNEFTPVGKAFAILVKRIDGTVYDTFSPDDLDRCLLHLNKIGLGHEEAIKNLSEVKKKSKPNWLCIIQRFFQRTETNNKRR